MQDEETFQDKLIAAPFTNDDIGSLVVNGTDSDIRDYPFMVSLRRITGAHMCGGTIIHPYWVWYLFAYAISKIHNLILYI